METNKKKIIRWIIPVLAAVLILGGGALLLLRNIPSHITVVSAPDRTIFAYGSTLDPTGLQLELTYRSGRKEILTEGFTCSPMELTEAGTVEITVALEDLTTTFTVESVPVVEEVYLLTSPDREAYFPGDTFDPKGLSLIVFYNNGTDQIVDSGYTVLRGPDMTRPGEFVEILEYEGYEFLVPITIFPEVTFDNIRFFMVSQCDDAGNGYNRSGENVNWTLMTPFDLPVEVLEDYPPQISCSWSEDVTLCYDLNESYSMAKEGKTSFEYFHYGASESMSGNPQVYLFLMLPDDPSIEGIQSFTISVGRFCYTVQIDLEYLGDYENGTGWYVWAV